MPKPCCQVTPTDTYESAYRRSATYPLASVADLSNDLSLPDEEDSNLSAPRGSTRLATSYRPFGSSVPACFIAPLHLVRDCVPEAASDGDQDQIQPVKDNVLVPVSGPLAEFVVTQLVVDSALDLLLVAE
jgi:hypothetical protein